MLRCLWRIQISLGDVQNCANTVGFRGLVPVFPHLCPLSVPEVGYVGYIRKALEKGYLEHRGLHAVLTTCLIFVRFGRCLCCFLPVFVNRQPPCLLHTNLRHAQNPVLISMCH